MKLEIITKLTECAKDLNEHNLKKINEKIILSLGVLHPDLIFYSHNKGFIYFDFIFSIIINV